MCQDCSRYHYYYYVCSSEHCVLRKVEMTNYIYWEWHLPHLVLTVNDGIQFYVEYLSNNISKRSHFDRALRCNPHSTQHTHQAFVVCASPGYTAVTWSVVYMIPIQKRKPLSSASHLGVHRSQATFCLVDFAYETTYFHTLWKISTGKFPCLFCQVVSNPAHSHKAARSVNYLPMASQS